MINEPVGSDSRLLDLQRKVKLSWATVFDARPRETGKKEGISNGLERTQFLDTRQRQPYR